MRASALLLSCDSPLISECIFFGWGKFELANSFVYGRPYSSDQTCEKLVDKLFSAQSSLKWAEIEVKLKLSKFEHDLVMGQALYLPTRHCQQSCFTSLKSGCYLVREHTCPPNVIQNMLNVQNITQTDCFVNHKWESGVEIIFVEITQKCLTWGIYKGAYLHILISKFK